MLGFRIQIRVYLEGRGDLVSRLRTPITHIVNSLIPFINLLTIPVRLTPQTSTLSPKHYTLNPTWCVVANWVARRRAAKFVAQQCGFVSWGRILWVRYLSYWGHAARLGPDTAAPIRMVLGIPGRLWLLWHGDQIRRQPGFWPNRNRFLQEKFRAAGQPHSWQVVAQDRQTWSQWTNRVLLGQVHLPNEFYTRPQQLDLCGRCLVQPDRLPPFALQDRTGGDSLPSGLR